MDLRDTAKLIRSKTCLVTGGGGSIGAELVRRLASLSPERIVIADICENGAYRVKCETGDIVRVEIASVRDRVRMESIMSQYTPSFVFHAAAHKHVPFMEDNPCEAVKNNIAGTQITAELAEKYGADNFILISTDKAVEPISVMGASKRLCEMLVYEKSLASEHTKFTAVRFGNVLLSDGSVIPLFKNQLEKGTLTVTDPDVTRYFMTVSSAAELVLNSLAMAEGGEVFVPDMGEDVKILDIACGVIREAGKIPYEDIKIEFTGLRRGDKLHEKLFYDFEKPEKTPCDRILRVGGSSTENLYNTLERLYALARAEDKEGVRSLLLRAANN